VKDAMLWELAQAKRAADDAADGEKRLAGEYAAEMREWVELTNALSAELNALRASLLSAIADVQNPQQYESVKLALERFRAHPLCQPDEQDTVHAATGLLTKLEHMWLLKQSIQQLNQKTIAEIKSFQIPLPEIEHVMRAVCLVLGDTPGATTSWNAIKVVVGRTGKQSLKRRIAEFVPGPGAVPGTSLKLARTLMQGIAVDRIAEVSVGTMTFYAWVAGVLEEVQQ